MGIDSSFSLASLRKRLKKLRRCGSWVSFGSKKFGPKLHYAAIESNRELNKSLKVIALLLLFFGPNMIIFLTCVKRTYFSGKIVFRQIC